MRCIGEQESPINWLQFGDRNKTISITLQNWEGKGIGSKGLARIKGIGLEVMIIQTQ
jgi:hypothetical protein